MFNSIGRHCRGAITTASLAVGILFFLLCLYVPPVGAVDLSKDTPPPPPPADGPKKPEPPPPLPEAPDKPTPPPAPDSKPTVPPSPTTGPEKPTPPPTPDSGETGLATGTPTATMTPVRPSPVPPTPTPTFIPIPRATSIPTPAPIVITGRVFDDEDNDGVPDPGERGVAAVPVTLDGEVVTTSDGVGGFSVTLPQQGHVLLSIVPPEGWRWEGKPLSANQLSDTNVAIPLRRQVSLGTIGTTTVTGSIAVAALLVGLAFSGMCSLAQAASTRSLERTYRRQKSQELEFAMASDLTRRKDQTERRLADDAEVWRKVVAQLLADAGIGGSPALEKGIDVREIPCPHFVIREETNRYHYVFTVNPEPLRKARIIRRRDRVVPLDTTLSLYARIEAQALWDHVAPRLRHQQTMLARDATWFLVVHQPPNWRPRARRRKWWQLWRR
jgi:hypothetical protein